MSHYIKGCTRKGNAHVVFDKNNKFILAFGAAGDDYCTIHKDNARMERDLARYAINEKLGSDGVELPRLYSIWVLWNKPSLTESIKYMNTRFITYVVKQCKQMQCIGSQPVCFQNVQANRSTYRLDQ